MTTGEDKVYIVFVTENNCIPVGLVKRAYANAVLSQWYILREKVRKGIATMDEQRALEFGTFAVQIDGEDCKPEDGYVCSVIAWSSVIAVFVKETNELSAAERLAAAQEEILKTLLGESRRGEEWRGNPDDEPDDVPESSEDDLGDK